MQLSLVRPNRASYGQPRTASGWHVTGWRRYVLTAAAALVAFVVECARKLRVPSRAGRTLDVESNDSLDDSRTIPGSPDGIQRSTSSGRKCCHGPAAPRHWHRGQLCYCWILVLVVLLRACIPVGAETGDRIIFRFGEASIAVERQIVLSQPSPFEYSAEAWARATHYNMRQDQSLYLELTAPPSVAATSACGRAPIAVLRLLPLPPRGSRSDEYKGVGWQTSPTSNRGISRLIPPPSLESGGSDLYEFESDDLRDAWGNKQLFIVRGAMILLLIHITREIQIFLESPAEACFFRAGEEIARHVRRFAMERITTN